MNTKRSIYVLVFAILFVAAMFFMQSVYASAGIPSLGREARANQADIQRWAALGDYYSKKPASIDDAAVKLSRDADAARLQALGEAYLGINPQARQADAARWQAMGEYYSKLPASAAGKDLKLSRDADAAGWQALGESFSGSTWGLARPMWLAGRPWENTIRSNQPQL